MLAKCELPAAVPQGPCRGWHSCQMKGRIATSNESDLVVSNRTTDQYPLNYTENPYIAEGPV
jgi:hypothetical protein